MSTCHWYDAVSGQITRRHTGTGNFFALPAVYMCMKLITGIAWGYLLLIHFSCSRANEEMFLPAKTFEIHQPLPHTTVRLNDTLTITGTASRDAPLHGYEITIRTAGGGVAHLVHYHLHQSLIQIHEKWKNNVAGPATLQVEVSILLDHHQRKQTKTIEVQVVP